MNFTGYFENLISSGTVGAYISLGVWVFAALTLLIGLFFGFKRGFSRSVLRLITIAIAVVGAFLVASNISGSIAQSMQGMTLLELVDTFDTQGAFPSEMRNLVGSFDTETAAHLISLIVSLAIVPIVYIILFYVFKGVTAFIYWLLASMLGLRRRQNLVSRLLGGVIGLVQGVIITAAVLLPVAGFASLADDCLTVLNEKANDSSATESIETVYDGYIVDSLENPLIKTLLNAGGKDLFNSMTAMTFEDKRISSTDEAETLVLIYAESGALSEMDWNNPDLSGQEALSNIADLVGDDYYTATVVSGILRGVATAVENEAIDIPAEEPMKSLIQSMVAVFKTSNRDNLNSDLDTILHVYFILCDYDVLSSFDDSDALRNALLSQHTVGEETKTVIDCIVDELYLNPRTAHIVDSLTEISIKVMADSLGLSEDATEIYENVKTGVSNVLALNEADYADRDEYVEAVSTELNTTLKDNNINVDEQTLNNMSNYIADNYSDVDVEMLTDEDINKAILSYYNAYAQANPGDEIPDIGDLEGAMGDLGGATD